MAKVSRSVHTTFCDDVRHEQGNKVSLMGIYQTSLVLPAAPPSLLPKLCVVVEALTSVNDPFQKLSVELRLGDEVVEHLDFPYEALGPALPNHSPEGIEPTMIMCGTIFILQSIKIDGPCKLSVIATTEREEFLSNILHVQFAQGSLNP